MKASFDNFLKKPYSNTSSEIKISSLNSFNIPTDD